MPKTVTAFGFTVQIFFFFFFLYIISEFVVSCRAIFDFVQLLLILCISSFLKHTHPNMSRRAWVILVGINMELVPPFAAITASTLLGKVSTRCWNIAVGICFHSATRALVRSGTDVGQLGLTHNQHSNSSQRCSMGLRSGLCAGQSSTSTLISTNHFTMDLTVHGGIRPLARVAVFAHVRSLRESDQNRKGGGASGDQR